MLENMKKEKEKLLKYFSKNVKEASEFKYRLKVIENNTFEERFLTKIGFSALPFLFGFFMVGKIPSITNFIMPELIAPAISIGSFGIGSLLNIVFEKKVWKSKQKLKGVTNKKKDCDLLEEQMKYHIKFQKTVNKLNAIEDMIGIIDKKEKETESFLSNYTIKSNNPESIPSLENSIRNLETDLIQNFDKLAIATERKILDDSFWSCRNNKQIAICTIFTPLLVGGLGMILQNFPIYNLGFEVSNLSLFLPSTVYGVIATGYYIKRTIKRRKVFNKLNATLGKNKLSEKWDYDKHQEIEKEVVDIKNNIFVIYREMCEKKQLLSLKKKEEQEKTKDSYLMDNVKEKTKEEDTSEQEIVFDTISTEPIEEKGELIESPKTLKKVKKEKKSN